MTRIAASPQAEALVQMLEALSEATPGTIQQRSARSEMLRRANQFGKKSTPPLAAGLDGLLSAWNYSYFVEALDESGLDKDQVKAAIALTFG